MKSYKVKVIENSSYVEIYEYTFPIVYDKNSSKSELTEEEILLAESRNYNSLKDKNKIEESQYDKVKRRCRHLENQRWEICRLVDCNFDDSTKFMTLTFAENIQDINWANNEFTNFIRRLNLKLYKTKKANLKYIVTWEKQKRGAIHYHIILFDLPYIKMKDLEKVWGNGFVKINRIKNKVDCKENYGRYVSKYFTEDLKLGEENKKSFFKSRNLKKPIINKSKVSPNFGEEEILYTKEYLRNEPIFLGYNSDGTPQKSFRENKVKYTIIKKVIYDEWIKYKE